MWQQLPDGVETEEQRQQRLQKEERMLLEKGIDKSLIKTNPYLQDEKEREKQFKMAVETSTAIENEDDKEEKNIIKKVFKKKKGRPFSKRR